MYFALYNNEVVIVVTCGSLGYLHLSAYFSGFDKNVHLDTTRTRTKKGMAILAYAFNHMKSSLSFCIQCQEKQSTVILSPNCTPFRKVEKEHYTGFLEVDLWIIQVPCPTVLLIRVIDDSSLVN